VRFALSDRKGETTAGSLARGSIEPSDRGGWCRPDYITATLVVPECESQDEEEEEYEEDTVDKSKGL
jgi:hypothetical protein